MPQNEFSFSFTGTMADWQDFVRHAVSGVALGYAAAQNADPEPAVRNVNSEPAAQNADPEPDEKPKRVRRTNAQIKADEEAAEAAEAAKAAPAPAVEDAQIVTTPDEPDAAMAALMGAGAPAAPAVPTPSWPDFTAQFGAHVRSGKLATDAANELVKRLGIPSLTPLMTDEALRAKAVVVIGDMIAGK